MKLVNMSHISTTYTDRLQQAEDYETIYVSTETIYVINN